ncbi:MAG: hypothetical protein QNK30_09880 [Bacteroidales bacterium]|nr:hypothetical protein [Bacteroidales bacterium]
MKKYTYIIIVAVLVFGIIQGCTKVEQPEPQIRDYRQEMRDFVQDISLWAKTIDQEFYIIPMNGHELITDGGRPQDPPDLDYLDAVEGFIRENLIFGFYDVDVESPYYYQNDVAFYLKKARVNENTILITDYCTTPSNIDTSYARNSRSKFKSFAASNRNLNEIPVYPDVPFNENSKPILKLDSINNYLFIKNPENFGTKSDFLTAIKSSNYDLLITDPYFDGVKLTDVDLEELRIKENGGLRLVIAYLKVGEADNSCYYWNEEWNTMPPTWLKAENPKSQGSFNVAYWEKDWQDIIFKNNDSFIKKILNSGFDGAVLDAVNAYEYFEENGEE